MHTHIIKVSLITLALSLTGCANNHQSSGQVIGGITGAVVGSQFGKGDGKVAGAAIGAIAGSMIGGHIGSQMDEQDRLKQKNAFHKATSAPLGTDIHWSNSSSGHHGSVTPIKEGYDQHGHYCRGINQTLIIDGEQVHTFNKICKYGDNKWYLVD